MIAVDEGGFAASYVRLCEGGWSLSAKIELEAENKGVPICRTDAMIAAIIINWGASLYTLDLKHFQPLRAFGLKLFP